LIAITFGVVADNSGGGDGVGVVVGGGDGGGSGGGGGGGARDRWERRGGRRMIHAQEGRNDKIV
jgi:hypothetical protein